MDIMFIQSSQSLLMSSAAPPWWHPTRFCTKGIFNLSQTWVRQLGSCGDFTGVVLSRQRLSTLVCVETASNVVAQFWHSMQAKILDIVFVSKENNTVIKIKKLSLVKGLSRYVYFNNYDIFTFCYDCFDFKMRQ